MAPGHVAPGGTEEEHSLVLVSGELVVVVVSGALVVVVVVSGALVVVVVVVDVVDVVDVQCSASSHGLSPQSTSSG